MTQGLAHTVDGVGALVVHLGQSIERPFQKNRLRNTEGAAS
jgi:hypothetical protein